MLKVVAKFEVKSNKVEKFKKETSNLIKETRKEEGNLSYELFQNTEDPTILTFIEEWKDKEALELHMKTEHFQEALPKLKKLNIADKEPEINIYTQVK